MATGNVYPMPSGVGASKLAARLAAEMPGDEVPMAGDVCGDQANEAAARGGARRLESHGSRRRLT